MRWQDMLHAQKKCEMNTKLYMRNLMRGNHMYVNRGADENIILKWILKI
jgi:hypothetical protein